ncbi:MAG: AtpZ/AtpI family protein [Flavobacteriales bacterium]|jgi:hypothetical protein|nr:AtpZ/AtpI family protein [Flavobacteriales bacterium]
MPNQGEKKKAPTSALRFSGMAFSMAACIGLAVWFGRKWDESTQSEIPYGTLLGGVLGTGLAIWMVIRDLSR